MTSLQKSTVYDEPYFIAGGVSYLNAGRVRNLETNSLTFGGLLSGMFLDYLHLHPPILHQSVHAISRYFIYRNTATPETILFLSRFPMFLLSVLLGCAIFQFAKILFDEKIGLLALTFYVFCPMMTGYSSIATSDFPTTVLFFFTIYLFYSQLQQSSWKARVGTGLLLGMAFLAKFTNLLLIPILIVLHLILKAQVKWTWKLYLKEVIQEILFPVFMGFALIMLFFSRTNDPWGYWHSIQVVFSDIQCENYTSYLMGEFSTRGWWYYYLFAFLIKTPIPLLIGGLGSIFFLRTREKQIQLSILFVPILFLLIMSTFSNVNIGFRHILPLYPFLCILSGYFLMKVKQSRGVLIILLIWYIGSFIVNYPYDLAYFNEFIGGSKNGYKYLLASDLDWGQDIKGLGEWVKNNQVKTIYMHNFGTSDPDYYQIPYKPFPKDLHDLKGYVAISANYFQGNYLKNHHTYDFLHDQKPVATIGHSIFVFYIP